MNKQNLEHEEEELLRKYQKRNKKKKPKMRVDSKGVKDLQGLITKKINK
ncbi:hypothetical protein KAI65_03095 [Candidatus Parcubacteria bacterium]|nr:hypothetical protein [Candidatus Parcubacteria bacterium]